MSDQPCEVPLVERLRSVPQTAHQVLELSQTKGRSIPYGPWCHEAADEIDRLSMGPHSCSDSCQRPMCMMRRDLEALRTATEPFARMYRLNAPLNPPDGSGFRQYAGRIWPTMGDLRKLTELLPEPRTP